MFSVLWKKGKASMNNKDKTQIHKYSLSGKPHLKDRTSGRKKWHLKRIKPDANSKA